MESAPSPPPFALRRAWIVLAVGCATLATGVGLIAASQLGRSGEPAAAPALPSVAGTAEAAALLDGVPQSGIVLGSPEAPVTLVEYADLQCPYCRAWATYAFPELVRDYVRAGTVKIVFRGPTFELGRTGGPLQRFQPAALDAAAFRPAIDALLR